MIEQQIELNTAYTSPPPAGWRRAFRLRLSERRLLLSAIDLAIAYSALMLAVAFHSDRFAAVNAWPWNITWFASLTVVWITCATLFDIYNLARASDAEQIVQAAIGAVLVTTLVYTLTPVVTPPLISRGAVVTFLLALMAGIVAWRLIYVRLFGQPWFKQRALIVGTGPVGQDLVGALQSSQGLSNPYHAAGYSLVGMIETRTDVVPAGSADVMGSVPVLGGPGDLLKLVRHYDVDEVIDAITGRDVVGDELLAAMLTCHEHGLRVTSMSAFYERVLGRVPVNSIGHHLSDVIQINESAGYRLFHMFKRMLDMFMCLPILIVLVVVTPLVWLANALFAPGPLFYTQTRLGLSGRPFQIYKFRSMRTDAEKDGRAIWAQGADARITAVGRWLRRTRLDELPQFLNVWRGEMSIIGPRPERPEFVEQLSNSIPYYRARHAVRPGLTGWAQVRFRYGSSIEDSRMKLEYDLYYVKHATPLLDIQIMVRTVAIMLQMKGT